MESGGCGSWTAAPPSGFRRGPRVRPSTGRRPGYSPVTHARRAPIALWQSSFYTRDSRRGGELDPFGGLFSPAPECTSQPVA
jgi:hypothetical protein